MCIRACKEVRVRVQRDKYEKKNGHNVVSQHIFKLADLKKKFNRYKEMVRRELFFLLVFLVF